MNDWVQKLDAFLKFNEEMILNDNGSVAHEVAKALAEKEYKKFHTKQLHNFTSDFDTYLENISDLETK
jgi:hypothetical protein